jgi:hypothetical protein
MPPERPKVYSRPGCSFPPCILRLNLMKHKTISRISFLNCAIFMYLKDVLIYNFNVNKFQFHSVPCMIYYYSSPNIFR